MSTSTTLDVGQIARPEPRRAWEEYLRIARRLDAVRRNAAAAVAEQPPAPRTAHEELIDVRARLLAQRSRLLVLGVPEVALRPAAPELAVAAQSLAEGADATLVAVRQVGAMVDTVDAVLSRQPWLTYGPWLHRLLVVAPLVTLSLLLVCGGLVLIWFLR